MTTGKLLLSLHDVTPRHLTRLIRAEALFRDLGVSDVTYLVVPRYHGGWAIEGDGGFGTWCQAVRPFTVRWCLHGYQHLEDRPVPTPSLATWFNRRFMTAGEGEFLSLDEAAVQDRLSKGQAAFRRRFGYAATGFVAPAWLFNHALMPALRSQGFAWTEDHRHIYDLQRPRTIEAPVITWASRTAARRWASVQVAPLLLRRWRELPTLRIAVHPMDFDDADLVSTIRGVLSSALRDRALGGYGEV